MERIQKIAELIKANRFSQDELRELALRIDLLRGIGSGAEVASSGEMSVFGLLDEGAVVFDVGANSGDYARAALAAIRNVDLHCFEPSKKTFEVLEKNLGGTPAKLNPFGLGDKEARLTLYSPGDGSALASLSKRKLDHFGIKMDQEETVEIRTADAYCRERGIAKIDLLKIDVEGHEMSVLKGASGLLMARQVRFVTFEFGGTNIDSRTFFRDFFTFFMEHRMKGLFRITPGNTFHPLLRYTEDLECFRTANYLVAF